MNMDMDMGFTRGMQLSSLSYNTKWCVVWILNTSYRFSAYRTLISDHRRDDCFLHSDFIRPKVNYVWWKPIYFCKNGFKR
jgi:hypothetical protein